jgi:hypothetical protein
MIDDLERDLRASRSALPDPSQDATAAARAAMHDALRARSRAGRGPRSWMRSRRPRTYLLAAAVALVGAAAALAAGRWTIADLPPFGDGDQDAFVLPATDILPGGYERSRPPRYIDLPERPSLLFPPGVGYTQAIDRYAASRAHGKVLPAGAVLADPLPAGKVVLVRDDGRVVLDPAAPIGYSTATGLVNTLGLPFGGVAVPIARCQLLLGIDDSRSPSCDQPGVRRIYVREGVNGRWLPSPNEEDIADRLVSASTELSVIDHPTTPRVRLTKRDLPLSGLAGPPPNLAAARLALARPGLRLIVMPAGPDHVCFVAKSRLGAGASCGPRAVLASHGAIITGGREMGGPYRLDGLVGDGIERVVANDGTAVRVVNNAFTMDHAEGLSRLTFSGPVGSFDISLPRISDERRLRPDRTKERELIGIDLAKGGHASIRVAPNRGGGRCYWVYIKGGTRSSSCSLPSDPPLQYDVVTAGFYPGDRGYPYIYGGQFAPQVGAVEMEFSDGTAQRLSLTEGFALYEVPPDRIAAGNWPVAVTTFDRHGVALARDGLRGFAVIVRQQGVGP